jgi:hypothetical protein
MTGQFEDRYREMSDDELLRIAGSGDELAIDAEEAFASELMRRQIFAEAMELRDKAAKAKLAPDPEPQPGDPPEPETEEEGDFENGVLESRELVVIDRFRDLIPAQLAQGALKSAGIDSVLRDENLVRLDWFWSNLIGGVRLEVEPKDADAALEILRSPTPVSIETGDGAPYSHVICPRCGSSETVFETIDKRWAGVGLWFNFPLTVPRNEWYCQACGNHWKQEHE